MIVNVAITVG